jgi:hypothetical protein
MGIRTGKQFVESLRETTAPSTSAASASRT